jgi:hypothetical protein
MRIRGHKGDWFSHFSNFSTDKSSNMYTRLYILNHWNVITLEHLKKIIIQEYLPKLPSVRKYTYVS